MSPRQILRLLEMRFIYCVDLDLDLNFMHMFAENPLTTPNLQSKRLPDNNHKSNHQKANEYM